jgi:hypothetical protein
VASPHVLHLPDRRILSDCYLPGPLAVGDLIRVDGVLYEVEQALVVPGDGGRIVTARLRVAAL